MILIFLVTLAVISCLPASIAKNKGRSFGSWWVYGFLLFPIALIHSLAMSKDFEGLEAQAIASGNRKCPACAELVKVEAKICKHCRNDLEPYVAEVETIEAPSGQKRKELIITTIGIFGFVFLMAFLGSG